MFAYIQQYVLYILGAIIVVLLVFAGVQTVRLSLTRAELKVKDAQMQILINAQQQLVQAGEELIAKTKQANKEADRERSERLTMLARWQADVPPKTCEEAVQWGAKRVEYLKEAW